MKTLYALLVGINDYPQSPLDGCVNDVIDFKAFLEAYCKKYGLGFRSLVLLDAQASRSNIINGFEFFREAEIGAPCLFYYAGHGSYCPAPKFFLHLEPNGLLESIVCHDSRRAGGRDLLDKELSYLVWEISREKKLPFITIMDCCHSGYFRNYNFTTVNTGARARQIRASDETISKDDFLGIEHYKKDSLGRLSPPRGRRVQLAAARDREYAKEIHVGGRSCGVFTYSLIETLSQASGLIAYDELMTRVNRRIRQAVTNQSAQLDATQTKDRRLFFLSDSSATDERRRLIISHDPILGWIVNMGAVHGLQKSREKSKNILQLTEDGRQIEVSKIFPHCAQVKSMESYRKSRSYAAIMLRRAKTKFKICFDPDSDLKTQQKLVEEIKKRAASSFELTDDLSQADFRICIKDQLLYLSRILESTPVCRPVSGWTENSITNFLYELEKILKWFDLRNLQNRYSSIESEELAVEVYRIAEPGNYRDDAPVELLDWRQVVLLKYEFRHGEWHKPAFQLSLRNRSDRTLWTSLLYLGSDFSITNQLIPKQALEPASEKLWAADVYKGHPHLTIPVKMENYYHTQGIEHITEHIKILVSTEEFDSNYYNQKGIDFEQTSAGAEPLRSLSGREEMEEEKTDWTTYEINLQIQRPLS